MKKITCEWPTTSLYQAYHDHEWGRPIHDDRLQFEHLCLESLQCGLSWLTILNKRDIIRGCFDHFDIEAVSSYGESDIDRSGAETTGSFSAHAATHSINGSAHETQSFSTELRKTKKVPTNT